MSRRDLRPFIKAGYVWRWLNNIDAGETGFMAWRPAGLVETILYRLFDRRPQP